MKLAVAFAAFALLFAGCAGTPEPVVERPAPRQAQDVPLLADIPTLGHLFKSRNARTVEVAEPAGVPLLGDIPVLGHLFKSQNKPAKAPQGE